MLRQDLLLARAAEVDMGFDTAVFAQMLSTLSRFEDRELPIPDGQVPDLRAFSVNWASELVDGDTD